VSGHVRRGDARRAVSGASDENGLAALPPRGQQAVVFGVVVRAVPKDLLAEGPLVDEPEPAEQGL